MNRQFLASFLLRSVVGLLAFLFAAAQVRGAIVTDWTGFTSSNATGILDGRNVNGTIVSGPGFNGIYTGQFSGSGWLAGNPLSASTESIGVEGAAGGNQFFQFSSPLSNLRFYVDNFDSGSSATITAIGADQILLIGHSQSISYAPLTASTGNLISSNFSFDGEGDAILELTGAITSFRLQYYSGTLGNFVGYTFTTNAVPEPGSLSILFFGTAAFGLLRHRRRTQS
ncbi:MAG: PEP-CTERM sorting domain-containing protein [Pirellula sp.]